MVRVVKAAVDVVAKVAAIAVRVAKAAVEAATVIAARVVKAAETVARAAKAETVVPVAKTPAKTAQRLNSLRLS